MRRLIFAALALVLAVATLRPAFAEDTQARVATLPDSDRSRRIGFVTGLAKEIASKPYAAGYLIFAKGDEADKMIIVGMSDGELSTIYRARALLATLTASARTTQFFQQNSIAEYATFLDFLKLLGFKQLTITDGVAFTHQIKIE